MAPWQRADLGLDGCELHTIVDGMLTARDLPPSHPMPRGSAPNVVSFPAVVSAGGRAPSEPSVPGRAA